MIRPIAPLLACTTLLVASRANAVPPPPPPPAGTSSAPADSLEPLAITAQPPAASVASPQPVAVQNVVVARPSELEHAPIQAAEPRRIWGLGTVLGAGFSGGMLAGSSGRSFVIPALELPTIETRAFTRNGFSLDVSVPIANAVFSSVVYGGFAWSTDVFFNFNVGSGRYRFLVGPGLGFSMLVASYSGTSISSGSIRIPSELGLEIMTDARGFGFQLITRPWLEFAVGSSGAATASAIGGGMLFMIGFFGYSASR